MFVLESGDLAKIMRSCSEYTKKQGLKHDAVPVGSIRTKEDREDVCFLIHNDDIPVVSMLRLKTWNDIKWLSGYEESYDIVLIQEYCI